jgi:hypothetical protein
MENVGRIDEKRNAKKTSNEKIQRIPINRCPSTVLKLAVGNWGVRCKNRFR